MTKLVKDMSEEELIKMREMKNKWRNNNKEYIERQKANQKKYYNNNKELFKKYYENNKRKYSKVFLCKCGGDFTYLTINNHIKTKNHQRHLQDYPEYKIDRKEIQRLSLET